MKITAIQRRNNGINNNFIFENINVEFKNLLIAKRNNPGIGHLTSYERPPHGPLPSKMKCKVREDNFQLLVHILAL